jgi:hypothetical protein
MIDCFSRLFELIPSKDTTALVAARCLLQRVGRYGCPSQLRSDNGTQFVNAVITELLYPIGSEHQLITPYSHEKKWYH